VDRLLIGVFDLQLAGTGMRLLKGGLPGSNERVGHGAFIEPDGLQVLLRRISGPFLMHTRASWSLDESRFLRLRANSAITSCNARVNQKTTCKSWYFLNLCSNAIADGGRTLMHGVG
jgi:hypothetical protein